MDMRKSRERQHERHIGASSFAIKMRWFMKNVLLVIVLLSAFSMSAYAQTCDVEIVEGTPSKAYSILSPLSASAGAGVFAKKNREQLFETMKKKACKLNADAIVKFECHDTEQSIANVNTHAQGFGQTGGGYAQSVVVPVCSGLAIKWK